MRGTLTHNLSAVNHRNLKAAAVDYCQRGFRVIQLEPRRKDPVSGRRWSDAILTDPADAEAAWDLLPDANIGLVAGDDTVIRDLDQKNDSNGWQS